MKRLNEKSGVHRKLLLLLICAVLVLGNVFTCVSAADEVSVPEYFIGNNREELELSGTWKWSATEIFEEDLPDSLPKDIVFDKEVILPSYTKIPEEILNGDGSLLWYETKFSLANKSPESVIFDFGVGEGVKAVYVNGIKAETDNLAPFFKIGENTIVLVREFVPKVSYKYHFCDSVKLIFSNSPVITFANVSANVKEASVSFDIGLYNSRNTALLTDVSVTIYDKNMNAKGSYVIENVDVNENCRTTAKVTGISIEDFSEKTTWSAQNPYVYTAKITVSGDTLEVPFAVIPEGLFNTEGYKYGMDILVTEFFSNEKNSGYTWDKNWISSFFQYIKEFDWNVITYREGELPDVWKETALREGILLIDKNEDKEWADSQSSIWTADVDFMSKATDIKTNSPDSFIIPILYECSEGLYSNSPQFTGIGKVRLQNLFKFDAENKNENKVEEAKGFFAETISYFKEMIHKTFIKDNRYQLFLTGLGNTLLVAAAATLFGVFIGIIVAVVKVLHHQSVMAKKSNFLLSFFNLIAEAYTAIIRGTPVVVQLLITYNVIFVFSDEAVLIGIFAFSINSGAYISEIIRAGINSVDKGQTEAGRSLGLSQFTTMKSIVLPQALKNILPALGNEFIALLKETSVIGYLGVIDLTRAGEIIRSRTADAFFTLIFVAVIYFILVFGLSLLFKYFEKRLSKSDKN